MGKEIKYFIFNNKLFFIYFNRYFLSIIIIKKQIHL